MIESRTPSKQNIILIGFMGVGKSTIGRQLSQIISYPQLDTDNIISDHQNCPIKEIFETKGEDYFRGLELQVINQMLDQKLNQHIVSTGGGIVTRSECGKQLRQLGFVVWLTADIKTILQRTSSSNHRPLLNCADPQKAIEDLLKQRVPLYKKCSHLKINTDKLTPHEVTTGIIESANYHFSS